MSYDWKLPSPSTPIRQDAALSGHGPIRSLADLRARLADGFRSAAAVRSVAGAGGLRQDAARPAPPPVRSSAELRRQIAAGLR